MPFGLSAYRTLTTLIAPALPLVLKRRLRAGKEHPTRWRERLGHTDMPRPDGPLIWLHGASVGEGLSLLPLVDALVAADAGLTVLVTTGTVTSAELLRSRMPPITGQRRAVHQFAPVDTPAVATRFLDHWKPDLAVFAESEVWPNLLREVRGAGGRTALVSARLSRASLDSWARAPAAAREVFGGYDLVLAQDEATAAALVRLGARDDGRLNLKLAGGALPVDEAALARLRAAAAGRPVLLAASTHPGEEEEALDAFLQLVDRPDAPRLVLAPRHTHRGAAIQAMARGRGFAVSRQGADEPFGPCDVHVADAMGELGPWFRLAASAYVGGGLQPGIGGHNPLEPARLGAPIVAGPHRANWEDVHRILGDAVVDAPDAAALAQAWRRDLDDPAAARARAARATARLGREDAAVAQAATRLAALLSPGEAAGEAGRFA